MIDGRTIYQGVAVSRSPLTEALGTLYSGRISRVLIPLFSGGTAEVLATLGE